MAELVAGAFLSSFLQVAFDRLASADFVDFFRRKKLDDGLLRKLEVILISVDKIVEDAEERQYRDHRVKQWLHHLKDEVFKAQDLLDDIATEAARQNLHAESQTAVTCKVRGFFTALLNPNQFEKTIETEIQGVLSNLEYLVKQNEILGLREGPSAGLQSGMKKKLFRRSLTTNLIDESKVCGRDADKERIVQILLSPNTGMGGNQLPIDVIAITGMGGMGKTTLARLVYEEVKDQFQHTAWVCVSEEFDVAQVTKAILQSLNCATNNLLEDFHSDQLKLKETLTGKEFFLVLDDVWNENFKIWEDFQAPLKHVAPQSKILITTRNENVVEVMCCNFTHALKPLKEGDCWNLFAKHAFDNQDDAADPKLVQIGGKIVNKCGGLPLAIKTLASLLRRKRSFHYWDKIMRSDIWDLSENDSNIMPSLRLSYHYLPSNLKRCFAYCSIFPKDYDIDKNELIQLWMADGLIYPTQKSMSLEEVGNEMFNDLESRSFFEPSRRGDDYFTMHDLVNDLAKFVTQDFFVQLEWDQKKEMSTKTRYFSYASYYRYEGVRIPEKVFKCLGLRSFLLLDRNIYCSIRINVDIMSSLSRLKYTRELSLRGCENIKTLSDGISNLKHLHYLDLSLTSIERLPKSMCLLINLQTMKLRNCRCLTKLPSNLFKLLNLRHLDLEYCPIQKMPKYMGRLNQLRTMNNFAVPKRGGSNIKELGGLMHLKGSLTISNMMWINGATDVREANLKEKELDTLRLHWNGESNYDGKQAQHHEQLLEAFQPNSMVKDLTVIEYGGTKFPKWVGGSDFLPHLVSLHLRYCANIVRLPPLGQLPSLQKLTIEKLDGVKVIGEEFYGNGSLIAPFPSLSYLMFIYMGEWEEWEICYEGECFPCLEQLIISVCPRLKKSLPQHLPCLKTLFIYGCGSLEATLPKSSSMEKLTLNDCKIKVKDMPTWSILDVPPPLHCLELSDCPAMESLPKGGMISSLQHLTITSCPKVIDSFREWGLHELLSLEELTIWGDFEDGRESFPEEGLLPSNLQSLSLSGCDKLRRINHRGLAHLRSLTSLYFYNCPILSFEGMPQDAFPPSLSHLTYGWCPLLKERCEKEKGPDWPLIS